jgi:hypothetical protein
MTRRLAIAPESVVGTLDSARTLFHEDVENRNGVTRMEAEEVLAVLDQLIAWNPPRLVHMPHNPKLAQKQQVIKFGLKTTGPVFWSAHPGPVYGAKLVIMPQADESFDPIRAIVRKCFHEIDHGKWAKAHPYEEQPTIEFRYLRFPRDFDRVVKVLGEALDALPAI